MGKGSSNRKKDILEKPEGRTIERAEIWIYIIDNPFHLEFYKAYLMGTKIITPDAQGNDI